MKKFSTSSFNSFHNLKSKSKTFNAVNMFKKLATIKQLQSNAKNLLQFQQNCVLNILMNYDLSLVSRMRTIAWYLLFYRQSDALIDKELKLLTIFLKNSHKFHIIKSRQQSVTKYLHKMHLFHYQGRKIIPERCKDII